MYGTEVAVLLTRTARPLGLEQHHRLTAQTWQGPHSGSTRRNRRTEYPALGGVPALGLFCNGRSKHMSRYEAMLTHETLAWHIACGDAIQLSKKAAEN